MNEKEIGELRRRQRRDRSNITAIYGCYVNDNKEIITQFRQSTGIMPENESDKYFALLRRVFSGGIGKNLIDITIVFYVFMSRKWIDTIYAFQSKIQDFTIRFSSTNQKPSSIIFL